MMINDSPGNSAGIHSTVALFFTQYIYELEEFKKWRQRFYAGVY